MRVPSTRWWLSSLLTLLVIATSSGLSWELLFRADRCDCSLGACELGGASCPLGGPACRSRASGPRIGRGCTCDHGSPDGSSHRDLAALFAPAELAPLAPPDRADLDRAATDLLTTFPPETPPPRRC